jgi:hypothetical protein
VNGLGIVLAIVTLPAVVVFFVAYHRVRESLDAGAGMSHEVPAATVVAGPARWTEGRTAQRLARRIPAIQAGLVSFAIASITFMLLSVVVMAAIAITS